MKESQRCRNQVII